MRLELLDVLRRERIGRGHLARHEQRIGADDRDGGLHGLVGERVDRLTVDEQVGVAEGDLKGDVRHALEQPVTQVVAD